MAPTKVRFPVSRPTLGDRERRRLLEAFDSGWISSQGSFVDRVTRDFPTLVGAAGGVPCANGTVALHLAMLALGAGPGDEVIVPNLTYVATANAPLFVGASPVLCDVRAADLAIDPARVRDLVTPRTRGVIAVHLYGVVADLTALRALCEERGLWLVEDCAEVLGAPAGAARKPGAWGALSTWSFYGNKVMTCGEGGFVTAGSRPDLLDRVRSYRGQGVDPRRRYWHLHLGFNFRLTNLQCAVLSAQMDALDDLRRAREEVRRAYDDALASAYRDGLLLRVPTPDVCWMYCARVPGADATARDALLEVLAERHGIETRPFFHAMDELPHLRGARRGPQRESHEHARSGFNLPTYVGLTRGHVEEIAGALVEAAGALRHGR